jgi:hypothetical protein
MKVKLLIAAMGFALLGAGWASGSTVPVEPGHFTVNLNDNCSTDPTDPDCSNPDGTGGWGADTLFTDMVNTVSSTMGFTPFTCTPDYDHDDCNPSDDSNAGDPSIRINQGGGSIPFPSSFNSDQSGGGLFDYQNDSSSPYTDILITTNWVGTETYTCASNIYSFCGFDVIHEKTGPDQLEILFIGGTIPNIPEPSQYLFLFIACAAVAAVHGLRSRRNSG